MNNSLFLEVKNLQVYFPIYGGVIQKKIAEVKAVEATNLARQNGFPLQIKMEEE